MAVSPSRVGCPGAGAGHGLEVPDPIRNPSVAEALVRIPRTPVHAVDEEAYLIPESQLLAPTKAETGPVPWVELHLGDERAVQGAIIFNEFKGTGRLINVQEEISFDFNVDEVVDVKI